MQKILVHLKSAFSLITIVCLTGCASQSGTPTVGTDTYKEQTTTTVSVDRATGAESRSTTTQIVTPGDEHRAQVNIDTDRHDDTVIKVESDGDSFRAETESVPARGSTTRIRAPLFKMDKNEDSGSVHIKLPFVHIDKDPGGSARVDIGRHH
ncbi:MAG: hypothetical protein WCT03_12345 [Candidatus Obscuribacterales bacterium]|jgi:hypothetical protein